MKVYLNFEYIISSYRGFLADFRCEKPYSWE